MENMMMQAKVVKEHANTKEEHLAVEIKSLLVSGTTLSATQKSLQVCLAQVSIIQPTSMVALTSSIKKRVANLSICKYFLS